MSRFFSFCILIGIATVSLLLLSELSAYAQIEEETDTSQTIIDIINANQLKAIDNDSLNLKRLIGEVALQQDEVIFKCDSAYLFEDKNDIEAFGNVHIQQGDSIDIYADLLRYDGENRIARLYQNVELSDKKTVITSDTLYYYLNEKRAILFGEVHITDNKVDIYSDSLEYFSQSKEAFLYDNVHLEDGDMTLDADKMNYDFIDDVGTYEGNGLMQNKETTLKSERGWYYHQTKDVQFEDSVYVKGPKYELSTDRLDYNTQTEIAHFKGNTTIVNEGNVINCDAGTYDQKRDVISIHGESTLNNDPQFLQADSLFFEQKSGKGFAFGNVYWTDTSQNLSVDCDYMEYEEENSYILATGNLLYKQKIEDDTLYLIADTLRSWHKSDNRKLLAKDSLDTSNDTSLVAKDNLDTLNDSSLLSRDNLDTETPKDSTQLVNPQRSAAQDSANAFVAYHNVAFYKSDFQGLCDSLVYGLQDSSFEFFQDPIIWFDNQQLVADSIYLQTQNNDPQKFVLKQNALIASEEQAGIYNQLKGDTIIGTFKKSKLHRMFAKQNAESIYFAKNEDEAFYGINQSQSDRIRILFEEEEIKFLKLYENPSATFHPIKKVDPYSFQLSGFEWKIKERPQSVESLYVLLEEQAAAATKAALDSTVQDSTVLDMDTTIQETNNANVLERKNKEDSKESKDTQEDTDKEQTKAEKKEARKQKREEKKAEKEQKRNGASIRDRGRKNDP